ncbi:hypothetical protein PS6_011585 [Mucor atramentarius]
MNNKLYYLDSPLPRTVLEKKYASPEEIVQILAEWAYKNHFELVIRKNDKDRLRRKLYPKEHYRSSMKKKICQDRLSFHLEDHLLEESPEDSKWKVLEQDCSKNENAHNHSLTLEECQLLPKAKKFLIGPDTIDVVQKMISAGNSAPEVKKLSMELTANLY